RIHGSIVPQRHCEGGSPEAIQRPEIEDSAGLLARAPMALAAMNGAAGINGRAWFLCGSSGLVHLFLGEPGQSGITSNNRLSLLERQNAVNVVEAVRGELLHCVDDPFGTSAPVHPDNIRRRRKPFLLITPERMHGMFAIFQAIRQGPRVQD